MNYSLNNLDPKCVGQNCFGCLVVLDYLHTYKEISWGPDMKFIYISYTLSYTQLKCNFFMRPVFCSQHCSSPGDWTQGLVQVDKPSAKLYPSLAPVPTVSVFLFETRSRCVAGLELSM